MCLCFELESKFDPVKLRKDAQYNFWIVLVSQASMVEVEQPLTSNAGDLLGYKPHETGDLGTVLFTDLSPAPRTVSTI